MWSLKASIRSHLHICVNFRTLSPLLTFSVFPLAFLGDDPDQDQWSEITRIIKKMNPFWTRIHRFIWSTMIQKISDRWSWSGSTVNVYPRAHIPNDMWYHLNLWRSQKGYTYHWPGAEICVSPVFSSLAKRNIVHIAGFHMSSLKFKLQNYQSYRDFTFTMY